LKLITRDLSAGAAEEIQGIPSLEGAKDIDVFARACGQVLSAPIPASAPG